MRAISSSFIASAFGSAIVIAAPSYSHIRRDASSNIGFDCTPPQHSTNLPLLSLEYQAIFPEDVLHGILKTAAPGATLTEQKVNGSRYYYDGDLLVGYFDDITGETGVFPKLGSLTPATGEIDTSGIEQYVKQVGIVPNDDTAFEIILGSTFSGSQKTFGGNASLPAIYLLESIIQRTITYDNKPYPVCGPGTTASFKFGASGSVTALSHKWRAARSKPSTITPISQSTIQQTILSDLSFANINNNITVTGIDLCFYDSGNQFIQPVYRYNATITHPFGLSDTPIVGYIPAGGEALEPLPSLTPPGEQITPIFSNNTFSNSTNPPANSTNIPKRQEGGITVGRYAMRGDAVTPNIVNDENLFWNGLSSVSNNFIDSQYYWDEPFIYESDAPYFVDAVNLAFTEGHGNVHYFTTDETLPGWGGVQISSDLPSAGYGPGAGGSLAYWIIRSCDVISSPADYSSDGIDQAFEPWWQVFNGLHAVMGYRTLAAVNDGNEMFDAGQAFARGQSVVHSWMSSALGSGKTSAVVVCGHDDDTVFQIGNTGGRPGCLQIWWYS